MKFVVFIVRAQQDRTRTGQLNFYLAASFLRDPFDSIPYCSVPMSLFTQPPRRFKPPASIPQLLTAMQSAGAYAELAVLAGSWEANDIERRIYGREWNRTGNDKLRGTFHAPRDGAKMHLSQVDKILSLFPDSHLSWWQRHPIAQILCDASLGQDGVLEALNTLPYGAARNCVWGDQHTFGARIARELPDTAEVFLRLANERTPFALLALIGRMRLAQLRGAGGPIDRKYEQLILQMLPDCIAHSPHLFLGQEALLEALWRFLRWSPYAHIRFLTRLFSDPPIRRTPFWPPLTGPISPSTWPGVPMVPQRQLQSRRRHVLRIAHELEMDPMFRMVGRPLSIDPDGEADPLT